MDRLEEDGTNGGHFFLYNVIRSACGSPFFVDKFKRAAKKHMSKDKSLKLCILEIGCGDRVPTMRSLGEDFLAQLWGCGLAFSDLEQKDPRAVLVRVNPDPKLAGIVRNSVRHLEPLLISLQTSAKEALCSLK